MGLSPKKVKLISCGPMAHISDIKLIRTDTTLDLSQKAEKGMPYSLGSPRFLYHLKGSRFLYLNGVGKTLESFTTCKELTGIIPCAAAAAAQFPATTPKPYLSVLKLFCTPETDSELMKNVRSKLQPRHIHTLDWNECGRVMLHLAPFQ